MAARHKAPGLGLRVKDAEGGPGAYVGSLRPGSPGEQAGVRPGDVVEELSGAPVTNAADLERIAKSRRPGQPTSATVRRNGERKTLIIPGG
ncbi:MAG TPA: PDZ domain-containing protein [Chloroflexota bacterium]|nr:PDZ domain-containing protein [Chloroflexota bacterium]